MKLRFLSGGAVLALVLLASACGSSGGSAGSKNAKALASSPGAKIFKTAGCVGCHTLEAAHAKGQVGPNLDELKPDQSTVEHQVRVGGNGMPSFAGRLSSAQIEQVASFVSSAAKSSGQVPDFKPDDTTVAECRKSSKPFCYRQAFGNLAYKEGPEKALSELGRDDRTISGVHADCHQITHWVGHAGLAYYKDDAGVALSHGAMTCNSGYYHGVMQLAFAGLPRAAVVRKARVLCTNPAVNTSDFLLYQCVHGLGHGLMIYSGDDLPWSLQTCHKLQNDFERISCTGGVFMQNLDTTMGVSRYLKANNPIYPCNIVKNKDKYYCYLQVTSRILTLDGFNWRKTAAWCRKAEKGWVETCFESYGRDASGSTQYHPADTIRICAQAGKNATGCIYGASRDYANNYAGTKPSVAICTASPVAWKPRCYEGIGTILGALNRSTEDRTGACRELVPRRYLRSCLKGAAVL
jgi:mono/diheme cytochrome c family protein